MEKPAVDLVDGMSPAVAIEQKNPTKTSRSTVGTATETYDYLRLLWARVGHTFCPVCGREMKPDTVQSAIDEIMRLPEGTRFFVAFPLRLSSEVTHDLVVENLRAQGFLRVSVKGEVLELDALEQRGIDLTAAPDLLVVVDRLTVSPEALRRLSDAVDTCFAEGDGECVVVPVGAGKPLRFSDCFECAYDGTRAPTPTPQLFSFNSPRGACPTCNGFGATLEYDEILIIPSAARTLRDGAIDPWTKPRYEGKRRALAEFCKREGIPLDLPWSRLTADHRRKLLTAKTRSYKGILPFLEDLEEKK